MMHVSPQQAQDLIARGDVQVVDVREPAEWQSGHLPVGRLVPLGQLRSNPKAAQLPEGVLFVCAAGIRSQTAARIAEAQGLKRVYNLDGGTRAWTRAGLPLVVDALSAAV
jgi:rhodanese-related sulfurtransferase